jgi:hypothetical protein
LLAHPSNDDSTASVAMEIDYNWSTIEIHDLKAREITKQQKGD